MTRLAATHALALGASLLMHVAAAAMVGSHRSSTAAVLATSEVGLPIELDLAVAREVPAEDPSRCEPPLPQAQASSPPTHRHSYPVAPGHDERPHDPSLVHLPWPSGADESSNASVPVVNAPLDPPVRFTLPMGGAPMTRGGPSANASPMTAGSLDLEAILPESQVTVPARLLASAAATYPPEARQAEVEADVPLEIVVDEQGRVVDAHAMDRGSYGLDEAAARSVRAYRFSAALKDGHPVRVRMRWVVQFRLR